MRKPLIWAIAILALTFTAFMGRRWYINHYQAMDSLPAGWNPKEMIEDHERIDGSSSIKTLVLLYRIQIPKRNDVRIESSIIAHQESSNGKIYWTLLHKYRHPDANGYKPTWNPAHVFDSHVESIRHLDHKPNNAEIIDFIEKSSWPLPETDEITIEYKCCLKNWLSITGEPPKQNFLPIKQLPKEMYSPA